MITLLISLFFLGLAIMAHLVICRLSPNKALKAKLFVSIAIVGLAAVIGLGVGFSLPLLLTSCLIYILLVPVYLIFYVSTELMSPSKRIMQVIGEQPGISYKALLQALEQERFITTRLEELVSSGCVSVREGKYSLTMSGQGIARFLDFYQLALGREVGG